MARDKSASLVVENQRLRPKGARQCLEAVSATANAPTSACQEVTSNSAMPLAKSSSENSSTAEKMSVSFARLFGPPIDNGQGIQWYGYYRQQSNPKKHRFSPAAVYHNNNTYRENWLTAVVMQLQGQGLFLGLVFTNPCQPSNRTILSNTPKRTIELRRSEARTP